MTSSINFTRFNALRGVSDGGNRAFDVRLPRAVPLFVSDKKKRQPGANLIPGTQLGDCILDHELEKGKRSVCWLARQIGLNRLVSVKVLSSNFFPIGSGFHDRIECLAKLEHPALAQIYSFGCHNSMYFLVREHLLGLRMSALMNVITRDEKGYPTRGSLPHIKNALRKSLGLAPIHSRWVFENDKNSLACAVRHIAEVAEGLSYAHCNNVSHGEICADNIIVNEVGFAKLLNFSIDTDFTICRKKIMRGYLAPEHAMGGGRSCAGDVFSLGAILCRLLTLHFPYTLEGGGVSRKRFSSRIRGHLFRIPRGLAQILSKALAWQPGRRYSSAGVFAQELRKFLSNYSRTTFFSAFECGPQFYRDLLRGFSQR